MLPVPVDGGKERTTDGAAFVVGAALANVLVTVVLPICGNGSAPAMAAEEAIAVTKGGVGGDGDGDDDDIGDEVVGS
jgi:hypothetical protein